MNYNANRPGERRPAQDPAPLAAVKAKLIRLRPISLFLLLLLFTPGLFTAARPAAAQMAPDPRFGVVEAFWDPAAAVELNVGWERILFFWREIQPAGPEDWNTLHVREEWLVDAAAAGREVVGLLKNTPLWATDDDSEAGVPRGLYRPLDDPENLWANYVRRIAAYYGPLGVHHWIIWNEPEIPLGVYGHEFSGDTADYVQMLKVAYLVMKEADPEAVIHLAGLTWWHNQAYLGDLLAAIAADPDAAANDYFFDAISLHIYFRSETVATIVQAADAAQRAAGLRKPIWVVETNAAPTGDPEWPVERPQFPLDLEQQAWYIAQAYALGFAAGAERIGVYKLIDINLPPGAEAFGLLRPDHSRRPAFTAYQTTIAQLSGFTRVAWEETERYQRVVFDRPGARVQVMWARTADGVDLAVPGAAAATAAQLIDVFGAAAAVAAVDGNYAVTLAGARCSDECYVGGAPWFLVEQIPLPTATPAVATATTAAMLATATVSSAATPPPAPTLAPAVIVAVTPAPTATTAPLAGSEPVAGSEPAGEFPWSWVFIGGALVLAFVLLRLRRGN